MKQDLAPLPLEEVNKLNDYINGRAEVFHSAAIKQYDDPRDTIGTLKTLVTSQKEKQTSNLINGLKLAIMLATNEVPMTVRGLADLLGVHSSYVGRLKTASKRFDNDLNTMMKEAERLGSQTIEHFLKSYMPPKAVDRKLKLQRQTKHVVKSINKTYAEYQNNPTDEQSRRSLARIRNTLTLRLPHNKTILHRNMLLWAPCVSCGADPTEEHKLTYHQYHGEKIELPVCEMCTSTANELGVPVNINMWRVVSLWRNYALDLERSHEKMVQGIDEA